MMQLSRGGGYPLGGGGYPNVTYLFMGFCQFVSKCDTGGEGVQKCQFLLIVVPKITKEGGGGGGNQLDH